MRTCVLAELDQTGESQIDLGRATGARGGTTSGGGGSWSATGARSGTASGGGGSWTARGAYGGGAYGGTAYHGTLTTAARLILMALPPPELLQALL